ncbi:MAG: DPP IV N-terminal domain-containing protein [Zavarzinella sp.]
MKPIIWPICTVLCLLGLPITWAVAEEAAPNALLTLDQLFSTREFEAEGAPPMKWSEKSAIYYTLDKAARGTGVDLVKNDPATGKKEILLPAAAFQPAKAKSPLRIEGFEFSANEDKLLIYTNSKKVWRRNTRGDYWVYDLKAKQLKKLGGKASPSSMMFAKFSPTGKEVAYVQDHNIYVQNLDTMAFTQVTKDGSKTLINGTSDWVNEEELNLRDCFRWSTDGKQILFWQFDTTGVSEFHMINNVVSNTPKIITFPYPKVGSKNSACRLGIIPTAGGDVTWVKLPGDPREHYIPHAEWHPDGKTLYVQQFNRLQTELGVFRVNPTNGEVAKIATETDAAWLENDNPFRWINDGKSILWLSERSGWRHAYNIPLDGSDIKPITSGKFDLLDLDSIDEKNGVLYYSASPEKATQKYLYRIKFDGSGTELLCPKDQRGWHQYNISPDSQWAVHNFSNFTTPPVIELVELKTHKIIRKFTDNSKLKQKIAALQMPKVDFIQVDVGSGIQCDSWIMQPANVKPTDRLPLLMYVYGEPHGQTVRDSWAGSRGMWHWLLAQQGFVVASVDNRGTNVPRGREWRKAVHKQVGTLASKEQANAVKTLLKRYPHIDPKRVGSWGWSGGGSMTLNAIFRYPEIYRTAVAIAPVADQKLYDTIYQERYMGLPTENAAGYLEGSPITHAHKLRGNLLLIHGTGDDNCHYQASERLLERLIETGKYFTVLPYPNRSHSVNEGKNTVRHFWGTVTRYLIDHLQAPYAPEPESVYEVRKIRGWTVHINRLLLATEPRLTARALELMEKQLEEIIQVVPKDAVKKLQTVPLYFNPPYPGKQAGAEYHPGADWLRKNGRDPIMAKAVEFSNVQNFEAETNRMKNFVLHELAHAYHDQMLPMGFKNQEVQAAYIRAKESGSYDNVERHFGNGKPNTKEKAYAMTTPMEYFAESTEAYFSKNDFFPFNREELKKHDPAMFELLGKLWK